MREPIFKGIATALVTPFFADGTVDYESYGRLIDWQIEQGINGLVACGTTGEGSTLTDEEHKEVIRYTVERVAGRVPVIAGTGSNDTAYAIELTRYACEVGADAMLVVTPYYNKATQEGLYRSFTAIADASTKPIIMYNVPSRTGCNMTAATAARLAEHPMICAIKEASGDISHVVELAALAGDKLHIYSGNDDQIVPIMSMGGLGCISVLSNVAPAGTVAISDAVFAGDYAKAAALQCKYLPLIKSLFCEVNPIPVKAATAAMGFGVNALRLPLTPMEEAHEAVLLQRMREVGVPV